MLYLTNHFHFLSEKGYDCNLYEKYIIIYIKYGNGKKKISAGQKNVKSCIDGRESDVSIQKIKRVI